MFRFERITEYGLICIIGILAGCYIQSLNKIVGSNCTSMKCGCISIKRQPLDNNQALEILEQDAPQLNNA